MYGSGFLLWNLGELKISQSSAKLNPLENAFCPQVERVRSNLPPILAPLTQLHGWWHLFAGRSILLPSRAFFFQCFITVTGPKTSPFQPHHNSIAGYATYMNIQFCLFHRLSYLKLSPRYTSDLMGVAVQVWRIEVKRWSDILAGDQVCICVAHSSPYLWFSSCFTSWKWMAILVFVWMAFIWQLC